MLTGRLPFEGENALTLGIKHKTEIPDDPVKINSDIPKDLSLLILKCLAKNKEDRYQSAAEVKSELIQIEQGLPTAEKPVLPKKPLTSKEFTVQIIPKKMIIPAFVLLAAVLAAFFLLRPQSGDRLIPASTDKPSLAVIYFENNSGNIGLDHWRSGLCELLITDLSQSKYLHVLSGDRIYSMLDKFNLLDRDKYTTADLTKVAAQAGANHILRGNYMTAGKTFIINISLLDAATGVVISSLREEGLGEESISGSVDKITRAVKAALNFSPQQIESDIDKDIGVVTTKSPEAYKYYVEGIRCDIKRDYPQVVEYMQKAVAVDPEFVTAYLAMSWASGIKGMKRS